METQSVLRKAGWLLAGAVAAILSMLAMGDILVSCESVKRGNKLL